MYVCLIICALLVNYGWNYPFAFSGFAFSGLIIVCGTATGWLIGMLASPASEKEEQKFSTFTTGVIGFLTGYAAQKIFDPVINHLFESDAIFSNPVTAANTLIFVSSLFLSMISGYSYRKYLANSKPQDSPPGKG